MRQAKLETAGESLFTPGVPGPRTRNVLTAEQVQQILKVLHLREKVAVRLAILEQSLASAAINGFRRPLIAKFQNRFIEPHGHALLLKSNVKRSGDRVLVIGGRRQKKVD